jgi:hypothetical protein
MKVFHFCLAHEYEGAPIVGAHKLSHHLQNLEEHEKGKCFLLTLTFVYFDKFQMQGLSKYHKENYHDFKKKF